MASERTYPTTPMCNGEILAGFEPTTRDSDVFVATTAKCGQTWLLTLLFHLKTHGEHPDLMGKGLHAATPWLEIPTNWKTLEKYDTADRLAQLQALEDPRVFKLHVVWDEIPRAVSSTAHIITITRERLSKNDVSLSGPARSSIKSALSS